MPLEDPKSLHPSHNQHLLSLIQNPSSFKCHACNVDDNIKDMSYKCTRCQFWIHKSCADAPMSFHFQFHDKHPLILSFSLPLLYHKFRQFCGVCSKKLSRLAWIYYCRYCRFFAHFQCARSSHSVRPRVAKHPWDIHPLRLIYEPGMVDDHEHDFNCEFCSEDIDTNRWFYHCSDCDLSFHLYRCFDESSYRQYSRVKFGATDIIIDKLHPHSLTFVLNKKSRSCERCHQNQLGEPVLECSWPCKSIFCTYCIQDYSSDSDSEDDSSFTE
ncbi:hypothetical protein DCAR_0936025 [Daucus carota subsp. sativus]|uniref:DC1 domain-containing protein n=1 Tax=Daucus carota subsp. sativus TaxID=79200 RepID=A0AAF0XYE6_DAUCS|nr:hypothetical protein DCAR_0936025 [Daucus carota subsp. sativus]